MKTLLLLVFIALNFSLQGQIHIEPFFEFGYEHRVPVIQGIEYSIPYNDLKNNLFCNMDFQVEWKGFSIFTGYKTYLSPVTLFSYHPNQVEYTIGGRYIINAFEFIGEHMCSHGVDHFIFNDGYTRASIKINLKSLTK